MPRPGTVAVALEDDALAAYVAHGLAAAGYAARRGTDPQAPADVVVFDGAPRPEGRGSARLIRLASRAPAPDDADAVLLYGDLFGAGTIGAFRSVLASLAAPPEPFDPERLLAPLHPADLVDAVAAAIRFEGRGVYDLAGPGAPAGRWRTAAAAVVRERGWPVAGASAAEDPAPAGRTADGRAAAEWAWRPRRGFAETLRALCAAAE